MTTSTAWVTEMRADALAKLSLTRRRDLSIFEVSRSTADMGYDLLVRVNGLAGALVPEFGVEVKGTTRSLNGGRFPAALRREVDVSRARLHEIVQDVGLAVCLFIFNIDTEDGVYTWLSEPVDIKARVLAVSSAHPVVAPVIHQHQSLNGQEFKVIDHAAIDRIVEDVVRAYGYELP